MNKNDLKLYLDTLGIQEIEQTLTFVEKLQKKHLQHFSFNNVSVLLGQEISLDIQDILKKIVLERKGGYCFEHNKLFYEVLREIGFDVSFVVAKVYLSNAAIDVPKTHRTTLLHFKNQVYLVDVGFGYVCPSKPLNINVDTVNEDYLIVKNADDLFSLRLQTPDGFLTLYKFDLKTYSEADCTMGNFYSSNYKNAVFVNNSVMALKKENETHSFKNNKYYIIKKTSDDSKVISSASELQKLFKDTFSLKLSNEEAYIVFTKGQ